MIKFLDPLDVPHEEFKEKYRDGVIKLRVNTNEAGYLFNSVLSEYVGGQANYRGLGFGGFIFGFIAIFFVGWWSLLGFAIGVAGLNLSRRHTVKSVISAALGDAETYEFLSNNRILAYQEAK
ncbi:hypothetical protein [Celeribacter marinus]|uniref:hypothetical protein n=1 Tax=Celeribacter marinus TaxID=1397108 RepID=UPI00316FB0A9